MKILNNEVMLQQIVIAGVFLNLGKYLKSVIIIFESDNNYPFEIKP